MAHDPTGDSTSVRCHGCKRELVVPKGPVNAAARAGRIFITYCSTRCQRKHFIDQQEQARARYRNPVPPQ